MLTICGCGLLDYLVFGEPAKESTVVSWTERNEQVTATTLNSLGEKDRHLGRILFKPLDNLTYKQLVTLTDSLDSYKFDQWLFYEYH